MPSADALGALAEALHPQRGSLLLSRVHREVRDMLDRSGVTARLGESHIYRRSFAGAMAFAAAAGDTLARPRG